MTKTELCPSYNTKPHCGYIPCIHHIKNIKNYAIEYAISPQIENILKREMELLLKHCKDKHYKK